MPTFWQRPLTWLFLIATACVDVVGLSAGREAAWFDGLLLGQIIVVGAWWALGQSHRLARAAIFVAAMGAFALPDFLADRSRSFIHEGPFVLGAIVALGIAAAVLTWCWQSLCRKTFGRARPVSSPGWRYPMAEILGWMTVVAVAVAALQHAYFRHLLDMGGDAAFGLAFLAAVTCVVALSLGDIRKEAWPKGIVESAWLILIILAALAAPANMGSASRGSRIVDPVGLVACLYVGAWVLTQKLDVERELDVQALQLHAPPSRDE